MFKTKVVFGVMAWALSMPYMVSSASAQQNAASANAHWVATWGSSQQQPRGGFARPPAPPVGQTSTGPGGIPSAATSPAASPASGSATPVAPPQPRPARGFNNQTLRMTVKASIGGSHLRVHLSNAYGTTPLLIGDAHIALCTGRALRLSPDS